MIRARLLLAVACLLAGAPRIQAADAPAPAKRPNILFILVDDQSPWDFSFYNTRSELRSPTLNQLVKQEGTGFLCRKPVDAAVFLGDRLPHEDGKAFGGGGGC